MFEVGPLGFRFVAIGRVFWLKEKCRSCCFNDVSCGFGLVERGAVHDDDVACGQLRGKHFLCPCIEHRRIGITFEAHGRFEHARAVTRDQRGSADAFAGYIPHGARAAW